MLSALTLLSYYWLIIFSIIGYGILFNKFFLRSFETEIGFLGFYGIFFLILLSYISSFFLPHTKLFNSSLLLIGLIVFFSNTNIIKKDFKVLLIAFAILIIFILVSKNHDDFPYYHFPYAHLLTEFGNMVGLGNFNHGFRTHSSIFYLSSLFNLPFSNLNLLHLSPVFFLGFSNIIFYKKIMENIDFNKKSYILYLSLLSFIFINIFFYRLAEHGTDRSAMILILVVIIELFQLINIDKNINKNSFLKILILLTLIISLKTFYILYSILLIPMFFYFLKKKISIIFFFKNIVTYLCLFFLFLVFLVNFFNSGCILYPVKILCFENFSWSIPISEVELMNQWYQQWAKAGANPNYGVENPEIYIQGFNWVGNWIDRYFFNKVSDFLLSILFVVFLVFFVFYSKKYSKHKKPKFWFIYLILIFLTIQWFYLLPTLRYGGYHLIALLFFIPLSLYLNDYSIKTRTLRKKVISLLALSLIIFLGRNISRLNDENELYNYNISNSVYYRQSGKNFSIFQTIKKLNKCNSFDSQKECIEGEVTVKFLNNSYIYYRLKK